MNRETAVRMRRLPEMHAEGLAQGLLSADGNRWWIANAMCEDFLAERGYRDTNERNPNGDWPVINQGDVIFIETVTKYWVGEVVDRNFDFIKLKRASWIADTGRFNEFLSGTRASEIEACPPDMEIMIPIGCMTMIGLWQHELPTTST